MHALQAFFVFTIAIFYETIDISEPKLQGDSSLLNGNPGMGFRPMPDLGSKKVAAKAGGDNKKYVSALKEFLKPYQKPDIFSIDCSLLDDTRPSGSVPCEFDIQGATQECNEGNDYGFKDGKPCVLVKLNKVYKWTPKLGGKQPDKIQQYNGTKYASNLFIPISCYTKDKSDMDDLGAVSYYPRQGFPLHFFPFLRQEEYLSPFVFVKFENAKEGKKFEIECRAYAENIDYDRTEIQGSVQFDLVVS